MTAPPVRIIPNVPRARITFIGSIGGAPFNFAWWFTSDGTGTHAASDVTTDIAAYIAFASFAGVKVNWQALNHTSTQIQQARLDYYNASSAAVLVSATKTGIAASGTISTVSAASQSVCVTAITGLAGRSGKGRAFMPATASISNPTSPYEYDSAKILLLAQGVSGWLSAINAAPAGLGVGKLRCAVQSLTLGVMSPVTSLRIDTRPDRQEHREKRLTFGNQTSPVTT